MGKGIMTKKLYINSSYSEEVAYDLDFWKDCLYDDLLQGEITLNEMESCNDPDIMWCSYFAEVGTKSESNCGRSCEEYKPCNGVSGRCKFQNKGLQFTGNKAALKYNSKTNKHSLRYIKNGT